METFERAAEGSNVLIPGAVWNRLVAAVERASGLTVGKPLTLTETAGGHVIGFKDSSSPSSSTGSGGCNCIQQGQVCGAVVDLVDGCFYPQAIALG